MRSFLFLLLGSLLFTLGCGESPSTEPTGKATPRRMMKPGDPTQSPSAPPSKGP
jgi:hypothetical protein